MVWEKTRRVSWVAHFESEIDSLAYKVYDYFHLSCLY